MGKKKPKSGPLRMGSLWGDEKGLKSGKLFTDNDRDALTLGDLWGKRGKNT